MTLAERIKHYNKVMPQYTSMEIGPDNRLFGMWIMGNNYQVQSGLYGGYPAGYLRRIAALFPDRKKVLHLFSGMVDTAKLPGDTVDLSPEMNATFTDDAQSLESVPVEDYDLFLADPPYSVEDADHYQLPMVKRNKVMRALGERARPGSFVVWLDQVLPMYRKDMWNLQGVIGMVKSTNHRFRVVCIFQHN